MSTDVWHGRSWSNPPIFELTNRVVMQVVEELQAVIAHHVRFLSDGDRNSATVDPVQCFRGIVEGNDRQLAFQVEAVNRFGRTAASCRLKLQKLCRLPCFLSSVSTARKPDQMHSSASPLSSKIFVSLRAGKFVSTSTTPATRSSRVALPLNRDYGDVSFTLNQRRHPS